MVFHAVPGFELRLDFRERRFEERPVLRRNRHDQVRRAVRIPHIILRFDQMLGESGAALAGITVEADDAFRFRSVAEALVRQDLFRNVPAVGSGIFGFSEEFRRIKSELADGGGQPGNGGLLIQVLSAFKFGKAGKNILEHAGSSTGSRDELAFSVNRSLLVIGDGRIGLRLVQDTDTPFRRRRSDNLHPRESFLEPVNLLLDGFGIGSAVLDLLDIFLAEHSVLNYMNDLPAAAQCFGCFKITYFHPIIQDLPGLSATAGQYAHRQSGSATMAAWYRK